MTPLAQEIAQNEHWRGFSADSGQRSRSWHWDSIASMQLQHPWEVGPVPGPSDRLSTLGPSTGPYSCRPWTTWRAASSVSRGVEAWTEVQTSQGARFSRGERKVWSLWGANVFASPDGFGGRIELLK
jgi:hypothetical protein